MSKKVLVLSGSPRKNGNSDLLCDEFIKGAMEVGNQAEKIFLRDRKINYCTGCGACLVKKGACSQKDDMAEILEKMIAADVIVMATPIYFYTMNGQMKTLIDRTCPRYREITDKDIYLIMTAADPSNQAMEKAIVEFRGFTSLLSGAKEKGVVYGIGAFDIGDIKKKPAMNQAYEMGKFV